VLEALLVNPQTLPFGLHELRMPIVAALKSVDLLTTGGAIKAISFYRE
jgi:hypothetical protein